MKELSKERRESTKKRYAGVLAAYDELLGEMGRYAHLMPRGYVYERLRERTGLCTKTVAWILNHWRE